MGKVKVLVVEDESIVSKDIQNSLKKLGYSISEATTTGENAIELARSEKPDIILMDIMIKGKMNGIEAAEIVKKELNIPIIFLTAYADESTLSKAKLSEPFGYIIKPFKEVDLNSSIEMAIYKHGKDQEIIKERDLLFKLVEGKGKKGEDFIFVKSKSKLVKLNNESIFYVEAMKDYVSIHTFDSRYTIHSTMKDLAAKLKEEEFVRVHRSYIVRLDKIATIDYPNLILEREKKIIPIGGYYRDDLNKRIKLV